MIKNIIFEPGFCPKCGGDLEYGSSGVEDCSYYYEWECEDCNATGKEWYDMEFKSYTIDELSDKAKEHAYSKWNNDDHYVWSREAEATLNEFCRIFDIKMDRWEYNSCNYSYRFTVQNDTLDDEDNNVTGLRLATYIWNNYAKYITKGKYYSLWSKTEKSEKNPSVGKLKFRYSKVMTEIDNCPLTGYCFDMNILDSIIDCLEYKKIYNNYRELIKECLDKFFNACVKDCEYCESMEYFVEEAQANEHEYDENGRAFYIPTGFQEVA